LIDLFEKITIHNRPLFAFERQLLALACIRRVLRKRLVKSVPDDIKTSSGLNGHWQWAILSHPKIRRHDCHALCTIWGSKNAQWLVKPSREKREAASRLDFSSIRNFLAVESLSVAAEEKFRRASCKTRPVGLSATKQMQPNNKLKVERDTYEIYPWCCCFSNSLFALGRAHGGKWHLLTIGSTTNGRIGLL